MIFRFCRRLIQKTRLEHDPTEDARATMELIQLKLSKSMGNFEIIKSIFFWEYLN
jgi:hypothetical protein